jgi:IS30 family transposase
MRPGKRFGLSAIEKREIWRRWKAGESLHEIGRAIDKPHSSIRCLLLPRGGMLIKVPSKETEAVVAALSQHVRKLPATLKRSLTWDRGLEMAKHKDFTVATEVQVFFCDPQSPWQRAPTKTPICCYGNTSREAPTCLVIRKRSSTRSRCA